MAEAATLAAEGLAGPRRRAAAPAAEPAQGQHLRRGDDRRAAGGAGRAPRAAAGCAACCSTPKARTSASAPASRSTWPTAARRCSASLHALILAHGRVPGAHPRGRARPVPGRRAGDRARRRADLRRARGAVRPARDQARRLRAGGQLPAAVARERGRGRRPAVVGPQHRRAAGAGDRPRADAGRRPRGRGAGLFRRTPRAAQRGRAGLRRGRRAGAARARVARRAWPRSSACTSTA